MTPARKIPPVYYLKFLGGGVIGQVGWCFFAFGMLFFWALNVPASARELVAFYSRTDTASGIVSSVEETNMSVNDEVVHRVGFTYLVAGNELKGISYLRYRPDPTSMVTVEYLVSRPQFARIEGGSYAPFGGVALAAAIFPLLGLIMVIFPLSGNVRRLRLMRHGQVAQGRLEKAEDTNMSVNDETVVRYRFVFEDTQARQHRLVYKTHQTERITDDTKELILYLADKPAIACLLDALPGVAKLKADGVVQFEATLRWDDLLAPAMMLLAFLPAPGTQIARDYYADFYGLAACASRKPFSIL